MFSEARLEIFKLRAPELLEALRDISRVASWFNIEVPAYSYLALENFSKVSPDLYPKVVESVCQYREVLQSIPRPESTNPFYSSELDTRILEKALDFFKLRIPGELTNLIEDGDCLEIYDLNMIQIYRNLNFFRTCGYSMLDLTLAPWYNLWQRPQAIEKMMGERIENVFTKPVGPIPTNIPTHIIRELYTMDGSRGDPARARATLVNFKYLSPAFEFKTGKLGGLVATCKAEVIALGPEAEKIHFI
jgi:hypothetical protein